MSLPRLTKRQVEQRRQERALHKLQRREERATKSDDVGPTSGTDVQRVLDEVAELHRRYDAGDVPLDELVTTRERLMGQLHVD